MSTKKKIIEGICTCCLILFVFHWFSFFVVDRNMANKPTEAELKEFKFITKVHILLVQHMGQIINEKAYSDHDLSKFELEEIEPYALKFIRHLSNEENPGWHAAVTHHYHNNKHHAQYWSHHNKEMPMEYIKEAVIDMICAKLQYQLCPEIEEEVRIDEYEVDENKLVVFLNEKLKDEELYSFNPRYLEPYTDDDKLTISEILSHYKMKMIKK